MKNNSKQGAKNNTQARYWVKSLKKSGYRLTKPRKLILKSISNSSKPLSADDIYLTVRKDEPNIGIATIYRTLELLTRLKLISKINFGSEKSFYTLSGNSGNGSSNFMICNSCGRIVHDNKCIKNSIKIRLKENAEKSILENCKIKIDNYQVVFFGLCDKCIKENTT